VKAKTNNKINLLLLAIVMLLVFVSGAKIMDTYSWLTSGDKTGFVVSVADINLIVKQDSRVIQNGGNIYLGTEIIEADKVYNLNITITNDESGSGYYVRCQVLALIGGVTYNFNSRVTNNLYKDNDGWMYITSGPTNSTKRQMAEGEIVQVINTITFPSNIVDSMQGKNVKFFLYIEGYPTNSFV